MPTSPRSPPAPQQSPSHSPRLFSSQPFPLWASPVLLELVVVWEEVAHLAVLLCAGDLFEQILLVQAISIEHTAPEEEFPLRKHLCADKEHIRIAARTVEWGVLWLGGQCQCPLRTCVRTLAFGSLGTGLVSLSCPESCACPGPWPRSTEETYLFLLGEHAPMSSHT